MSPKLHSVTFDKNTDTKPTSLAVDPTHGSLIVDETFDSNRTDSYHLSLEVSNWDVSYAVLDTLNNKYLALYQNEIADQGANAGMDYLIQMIQSQTMLRSKYKSASLALVHDQFTTIPGPLYSKSENNKFLSFNLEGLRDREGGFEVLTDKLQGIEAYNLFSARKSSLRDLQSVFEKLTVHHHTSGLIDTLLSISKNQNEKTCFLHFQRGIFSFVVIEGNDLRYCNNFLYGSKEDLAYYTLFVCEQLQLNPETLKLVLLGEIDKASPEYAILYTYIRNLSFMERNTSFEYSYKLDALPGHFHYNLFNQYHCVS